jgi:hypothetical protein
MTDHLFIATIIMYLDFLLHHRKCFNIQTKTLLELDFWHSQISSKLWKVIIDYITKLPMLYSHAHDFSNWGEGVKVRT